MATQATVIDGIASVFGNTTALLIGIVATAVLCVWVDPALLPSDAGIPWRQLVQSRSLGGILVSCRHACAIIRCRWNTAFTAVAVTR